MKKTPRLESQRLYYEPVSLTHCSEVYLGWLSDPEVNVYLESSHVQYSMKDLVDYVQQMASREDVLFWAIRLKENDKHIGNIKLEGIDMHHRRAEYGILVGDKAEWGKGYAFETSRTVVNYCFKTLSLNKITLGVVENNVRAIEVYKRLGFVTEGVNKHHGYYNGQWCNCIRMAIFNPDLKLGDER